MQGAGEAVSEGTGFAIFCTISAFLIGGGIGCLTTKRGSADELRDLRANLAKANAEGKVCCNAAYVAIKYRPDCEGAKP